MKKNALNISQREKNMLAILAAAVVAFVLFNYVMSPALMTGTVLTQEKKAAETELDRINTLVEQYPVLIKQEKSEKSRLTEKYKMFFYDLNQERILYKLDSLLVNSGFSITSYVTNKASAAQIFAVSPIYEPLGYPLLDVASKVNPTLEKEPVPEGASNNPNPDGGDKIPMDAIPTADITLSFNNATYESATAFIKSLENMDKSVFVRSVTMSKSETGIGGQIVLSLYSLPKLDDSDMDLLKFEPTIPKNKANPFS
jgi:hypothetical protein